MVQSRLVVCKVYDKILKNAPGSMETDPKSKVR